MVGLQRIKLQVIMRIQLYSLNLRTQIVIFAEQNLCHLEFDHCFVNTEYYGLAGNGIRVLLPL